MASLSEKQAQLEKLKKLLYSGVERTQHGDTSATNRSQKEIMDAIAILEGEIATLEGDASRRVRYIYQSSKGL